MRLSRQIPITRCYALFVYSRVAATHCSALRTTTDADHKPANSRFSPARLSTRSHQPEENVDSHETQYNSAEPMYGYAKRLEFKNQLKHQPSFEEQLRGRVFRRTLRPEESLLALDLVRKHKAMGRDARKLRKMNRETPEKARRVSSFKPLPFAHCEPTTNRVVRSIINQLEEDEKEFKGNEKEWEEDSAPSNPLIRLPEEDQESVGSLEDLKFRHGTPRPPRVPRYVSAFDLPLSRPDTRAFHRVQQSGMTTPDIHFAEWFIGMTEAQTPFRVTPEGRPYFALEHADMQLFGRMRSILHFGHADRIKQIWYVIDDVNLQRIIHLLNGNLFLEKSRTSFKEWVEKYRALGTWNDETFEVKTTCLWRPQLNNKWLMGLIDSSIGMFAARMTETDTFPFFQVNLKFWVLSQDRSLLELLQQMFDGGEIEKDGDHLRWTIKRRRHHEKLNRYCRMFRTTSLRNVSLVRYNRLVNYPVVKVKTQHAWYKIQNIIRNLNIAERKAALAMTFHPYHDRYKSNTQTQMVLARAGASKRRVNAYRTKQEELDFLWDTSRYLKFIKEVN